MRFVFLASAAVLTGLCFTWYNAWLIVLFSMIPLFLVLLKRSETPKKRYRFYGYGYLYGFLFYASVFYWFIYQYPLEYLGFSQTEAVWYVILTWFGIGAILSVLLAVWVFLTGVFLQSKLYRKIPWLFIPFTASVYVLIEFLLTLGDFATPWTKLAVLMHSNLPFLQTASVFGSYFISFLIVCINASFAYAIYVFIKNRDKRKAVISAVIAVSIFACNMAAGTAMYFYDKDKTDSLPSYTASALQGNIVSGRTETGGVFNVIDTFFAMAEEEIRNNGSKLVVMPEGCFEIDISKYPGEMQLIKDFAKDNGVTVIFNCYLREDGKLYNVTYCVSQDGSVSLPYKKQHPVPFGEYTPYKDVILAVFPFLEDVTNIGDDICKGDKTAVFESAAGRICPFICYDSCFEKIGFEATADGAEIFIETTNDSWYMDSAQLYQHNGHAVLRAVESRRCVIRSTSAGYSTIINSRGDVLSSVEPLTAGFASSEVYNRNDITFYHRCPYLWLIVCAAFIAACATGEIYLTVKARKSGN